MRPPRHVCFQQRGQWLLCSQRESVKKKKKNPPITVALGFFKIFFYFLLALPESYCPLFTATPTAFAHYSTQVRLKTDTCGIFFFVIDLLWQVDFFFSLTAFRYFLKFTCGLFLKGSKVEHFYVLCGWDQDREDLYLQERVCVYLLNT